MRRIRLAALGLAAALTTALSPGAGAADDFYRDKTLTVVVGSSAGGAYDLYARLLSRHLSRHIPGAPSIVVQTILGAGGLTGLRYLDGSGAGDGTVLATFNAGLINQAMLAPDTTRLDFNELNWIGGLTHEFRVCYGWHAKGLRNWSEFAAVKAFNIGAVGVGTAEYLNGRILMNVFGLKLNQIGGYPGSADERVAIERGELDGQCAEWNAVPEDWIRDGKAVPYVRWLKEAPAGFPAEVPFIVDLAPRPEDKATLAAFAAPSELGNPFVVSKRVPRERVELLRKAFSEMATDPQFLADASSKKMPIEPTAGAAAQKFVSEIYKAATPQGLERMRDAVK